MTERELSLEDIDAILAMQSEMHNTIAQPDWLVDTSREQFEYIFSGGGYGIGLFEGDELLGAWVLYYPFARPDALSGVMQLEEGKTAHFELAMLSPRLRGRGLHRQMVERLTRHAAQDGRFDGIAATAHPDNLASVRGFTGCGYSIFDTRKMYSGVMRCILYKRF